MSEDLNALLDRLRQTADKTPVVFTTSAGHPGENSIDLIPIDYDPGQRRMVIARLKPRNSADANPDLKFDPNLQFGLRGFVDADGKLDAHSWNLINPGDGK